MAGWSNRTVGEAAGPPPTSTLFFYPGHTIKCCPDFCCHGLLLLNSFTEFPQNNSCPNRNVTKLGMDKEMEKLFNT